MAIIECPECGQNVSDKAESCPHCGNPLRAQKDVVGGRQIRTVEKTSKRFKAHIMLSIVAILAGVVWLVGSCNASDGPSLSLAAMLLIFVGSAWFIVAKVAAWWHHG